MPFLIIKYTHHLQNHILFADCGIGRVILGCGRSNLKWESRTVWVRILKIKDTTVLKFIKPTIHSLPIIH